MPERGVGCCYANNLIDAPKYSDDLAPILKMVRRQEPTVRLGYWKNSGVPKALIHQQLQK